MFSGLRTGRFEDPAGCHITWNQSSRKCQCLIPTYHHSNSCWKQILLQYSNAATNCWYMLIYTQPKLSSNDSSQPLQKAACSSTPLRTAMAAVTARPVSPWQEATQKPKLKATNKEMAMQDGPLPDPIPQVSSHGRVVHLSNGNKILMTFHYTDWFVRILTGLS